MAPPTDRYQFRCDRICSELSDTTLQSASLFTQCFLGLKLVTENLVMDLQTAGATQSSMSLIQVSDLCSQKLVDQDANS